MAKVKCEFCGSFIDTAFEKCPCCGANNAAFLRTATDAPKTIEELQAWYIARGLPSQYVTRFFIGKNITSPKAFGIYKDADGIFTVYKNKADGSRAVRYQGTDETFAVNELYLRLKEEIINQKWINLQRRGGFVPGGSFPNGNAPNESIPNRTIPNDKNTDEDIPNEEIPEENHSDRSLLFSGILFLAFCAVFFSLCFIDSNFFLALLPLIGLAIFLYFIFPPGLDRDRRISLQLPAKTRLIGRILILVFLIVLVLSFGLHKKELRHSYFVTDTDVYYQQGDDWYRYWPESDNWTASDPVTSSGIYQFAKPESVKCSFLETEYYDPATYAYVWEPGYRYSGYSLSNGSRGSGGSRDYGNHSGYSRDYNYGSSHSHGGSSHDSWDSGSDWSSHDSWDSGGSDWDSDW